MFRQYPFFQELRLTYLKVNSVLQYLTFERNWDGFTFTADAEGAKILSTNI
jgi:hypothetical protein